MNSRERIKCVLTHKQPDKLPVDFGSSPTTGIHVSMVYELRQHFGLDKPGTPVKVMEPYQMLGEIADDLKELIGIDVANLEGKATFFGYNKENWKEWKLDDGTPVLVPELFNTKKNEDGSIYQYPCGDKSFPPCGKMPEKGFYFDAINRQKEIIEEKLDPKDNIEDFKIISENDLDYLKKETENLYKNTPYALMGLVACSGFGDIVVVSGLPVKDPKGIRDVEEWYISTYTRKDYVKKVFEEQCEIAIENYRRIFNVVGNMIDVVYVSGADFGMQEGLITSKNTYRELYKLFHKKVNGWIHNNTNWKCFVHTCGSVYELIPDLIEAGFDILNPVQISAARMNPETLKREFGEYITFWGGGVDTQKTLPLGTPKEVKEEVKRLIDIFSPDGGFVFSSVHNIQTNLPLENVLAMVEVIQEYRK